MAVRMIAWDKAGHVREFDRQVDLLEFLNTTHNKAAHALLSGTPVSGWFIDEALTDAQGEPLEDALMDTEIQARKACQRRLEARGQNGKRG